jgi:hypothetical protein
LAGVAKGAQVRLTDRGALNPMRQHARHSRFPVFLRAALSSTSRVLCGGILGLLYVGGVVAADAPAATVAQEIGKQIPMVAPAFNGKIGTTYKDSKSDFPQPVRPPEC